MKLYLQINIGKIDKIGTGSYLNFTEGERGQTQEQMCETGIRGRPQRNDVAIVEKSLIIALLKKQRDLIHDVMKW